MLAGRIPSMLLRASSTAPRAQLTASGSAPVFSNIHSSNRAVCKRRTSTSFAANSSDTQTFGFRQ